MNNEKYNFFMAKAIEQAEIAIKNNETPVGAIIVKNEQIISYGYNQETKRNCKI